MAARGTTRTKAITLAINIYTFKLAAMNKRQKKTVTNDRKKQQRGQQNKKKKKLEREKMNEKHKNTKAKKKRTHVRKYVTNFLCSVFGSAPLSLWFSSKKKRSATCE